MVGEKIKNHNWIHFKRKLNILLGILFLINCYLSSALQAQQQIPVSVREKLLMDFNWRFAFGHPYNTDKDFTNGTSYFSYFAKSGNGDGAASKDFDDRGWRVINLPHDWAVELPFSSRAGYSHGYKTIGRDFPETSLGWYRKTFTVPASDFGKRISIQFDGIFRNSVVWVNGFYLGTEHSGYTSFDYDISDYLNYGGDNVIAVRVDATMEEGWFYEGAGIYRHVWLTKTDPLHVARYGTFVSSKVNGDAAKVNARTTIINEKQTETAFNVEQTILDTLGRTVATAKLNNLHLSAGGKKEFPCLISLNHPNLWSIEDPYLYKLVTTVRSEGKVKDIYETAFGIRTLRFDAKEGFFLNGKHLNIQGTNNHQDHAGVGTAILDALQEFRIRKLKEMGANAFRCSHNPPTPELLDVCDRLGMLVLDENRLMGSTPEHLELLKRMILRDRNHPSVFIWSLGNEEWAIEGNEKGARITSTMQAYARQLDSTRRFTVATSGGWGHGTSTVNDMMGYNYIFNGDIDAQHAAFPNQPAVGTEETTSRSTRGVYADDKANAHMEATDRKPNGTSMETGLKFYAARPFLSGLFFWTGFDYRGEPNPYGWPQVASQSGILDLCGFPKDMFYYLKSWWTDKPVLHLFPHWNWKGKEGQTVDVWAYSNCDEVELFLNKKSLGRKTTPVNSHLEWKVNYEPGTLLARGYKSGKEMISEKVETSGDPASLQLTPDRNILKADREDVSVITVRANDKKDRLVPVANNEIEFFVDGPAKIIGVGNGDPASHEPDRYIEKIDRIPINGLKKLAADSASINSLVQYDIEDSGWKAAFKEVDSENRVKQDTAHLAIIRGTFDLSLMNDSLKVTLLAKSLGELQSVYINGRLIARDVKRGDAGQSYLLDNSLLKKGKNVYAVVCHPLVKKNQWENLNTDPGLIQVIRPASTWKRSLFNGLAQVIIQTTGQPGEITLTASSPGLIKAVLKLQSKSAVLRPSL